MISCCALQFAMPDNKYRKRLVEAMKKREDKKQDKKQDNERDIEQDDEQDICQCTDKQLRNHLCLDMLFHIASGKPEELKHTRMFLVIDGANIENMKKDDEAGLQRKDQDQRQA